jgi:hypothetical protein
VVRIHELGRDGGSLSGEVRPLPPARLHPRGKQVREERWRAFRRSVETIGLGSRNRDGAGVSSENQCRPACCQGSTHIACERPGGQRSFTVRVPRSRHIAAWRRLRHPYGRTRRVG